MFWPLLPHLPHLSSSHTLMSFLPHFLPFSPLLKFLPCRRSKHCLPVLRRFQTQTEAGFQQSLLWGTSDSPRLTYRAMDDLKVVLLVFLSMATQIGPIPVLPIIYTSNSSLRLHAIRAELITTSWESQLAIWVAKPWPSPPLLLWGTISSQQVVMIFCKQSRLNL